MTATATAKQRLDQWLWQARFFKSRTLAKQTVESGRCRVNRERVSKPGHCIRPGDILTFPQGAHVRVIEIGATATRRGPANEARTLYRDLAPIEAAAKRTGETATPPEPRREPGAGRPTKRERRQMETVRGRHFEGAE